MSTVTTQLNFLKVKYRYPTKNFLECSFCYPTKKISRVRTCACVEFSWVTFTQLEIFFRVFVRFLVGYLFLELSG